MIPATRGRTRLELLRARNAGRASYGAQERCPYPADDALAAMWHRGREEMRLHAERYWQAKARIALRNNPPALPAWER